MTAGEKAFRAADYAGAAAAYLESWDVERSLKARWNAAQSFAAAGEWLRARKLLEDLVGDQTLTNEHRGPAIARLKIAVAFTDAADLVRAGRWTEAKAVYDQLVVDQSVGPTVRDQASTAAKALADKLARDEAERRERDAAATAEVVPPAAAPAATPPPSPPQRDRAESATGGRDWLGWSLVSAGAIGVGVGVGLSWHAGSLYDQAANEPDQQANRDTRERADTQRIAGALAIGVGAAVVIGGALKLTLGSRHARSSVAVSPLRGGAAVALGGSF